MDINLILLIIILYPIYHAILVAITMRVILNITRKFLHEHYKKIKTNEKKKK
jgi:ABC-type maltose transport system permease subunit